jgi:hypothetical protein
LKKARAVGADAVIIKVPSDRSEAYGFAVHRLDATAIRFTDQAAP